MLSVITLPIRILIALAILMAVAVGYVLLPWVVVAHTLTNLMSPCQRLRADVAMGKFKPKQRN